MVILFTYDKIFRGLDIRGSLIIHHVYKQRSNCNFLFAIFAFGTRFQKGSKSDFARVSFPEGFSSRLKIQNTCSKDTV